jgi:phage-related protein
MVPKFGSAAARIWFVKQVFSSIWPVIKQRVLRALGILTVSKYLWR